MRGLIFWMVCCGSSVLAIPVQGQESRSVALSAGVFNFNKAETAIEGGAELRMPAGHWGLAGVVGLYGNDQRSWWLFAGLRRDFRVIGAWIVTPGFAVTFYEQGDGKDLGGPLEFRSAVEIGYEWGGRSRLALVLYHLSNAGIYERNPGSNSLAVIYSRALR